VSFFLRRLLDETRSFLKRDDLFLDRGRDGRSAVIYPQLIIDVDQVRFDSRGADVQCLTDLFVAFLPGHQTQHFDFTGAQVLFGRGAPDEAKTF